MTATFDGGTTRAADTVVTIGALEGTATSSDYSATTLAPITIPAGHRPAATGHARHHTHRTTQIVEGDETIEIPGTTTCGPRRVSDASIRLTDGDGEYHHSWGSRTRPELSISGPSSVTEGDIATFTVTLSHRVDAEVTVEWSVTSTEAADLGVQRTLRHRSPSQRTAPLGTTTTITIAVTDDNLAETAESFTVSLDDVTSSLSDHVSKATSSATAVIAESDPITVSIGDPGAVNEGDTVTYTVSITGGVPTAALTVDYATADGTATAGSDYATSSGMLTFQANSAVGATTTFTVRTTEDVLAEGAEDFTVSISGPAGGGGPAPTLGTASVTTTITDDDGTPSSITLTVDPDSIGEDDGRTDVTVTATIDGDSTLPATTTVTLTLSGTADSSDYTVDTALASVTIPAGQSSGSGTLVITPIDDQIVEGDETIEIPGTTSVGLSVSDASIRLTDGDGSTTPPGDLDRATVSIAGPSASVAEGSGAVFVVTLSHRVDAEVTVEWSP